MRQVNKYPHVYTASYFAILRTSNSISANWSCAQRAATLSRMTHLKHNNNMKTNKSKHKFPKLWNSNPYYLHNKANKNFDGKFFRH